MGYERLDRQGRERYLDRAVLAGRGYSCLGLLGQGAFSDVYCVEDAAGGGRYACKVSWHGQMLEREAKVLEGLHHPLYPEFYAFWREAEIGILLREYVEGDSLEEVFDRVAGRYQEMTDQGECDVFSLVCGWNGSAFEAKTYYINSVFGENSQITDVKLEEVAFRALPYLCTIWLLVFVIAVWPDFVMFLPRLLM